MHQYGPGAVLWGMLAQQMYLPVTISVVVVASTPCARAKSCPPWMGGLTPLIFSLFNYTTPVQIFTLHRGGSG